MILILRFRDLVVPTPGYTIDQHKKVITQHGYTWWGWWKKQSEQVPEGLWSELRKQTERGPATAYLLDSGRRKLYQAKLVDVQFDPGRAHMVAPEDGSKTPDYYARSAGADETNTTPFASWFKLASIEEVDEAKIRELAYAEVPRDDLVQATPEHTVNRRIDSVADLLLFGNVTYWVTKIASNDAAVAARPYVQIPPAIAPKTVVMMENHRVLHLSDLHVGSNKYVFASDSGDAHNVSLANALMTALGSERVPALVLVTGDLTWSGTADEYTLAARCLDELRSVFGLTRQHFVIVPGNHDLGWVREDPVLNAGAAPVPRYRMASGNAKKAYENFFRQWYGTNADAYLAIGRRYLVCGAGTLDVLGVNSAALQQVQDSFVGLGRVPELAFEAATREMNWNEPLRATTYRFLLTHHHLLPIMPMERPEDAPRGFGLALDAASQLSLAARYGVDLVLHGHQHHPFVGFFSSVDVLHNHAAVASSSGVRVVGGGSVSVVPEHLGPVRQNTFNLLELDASGTIRSHLYTTDAGRAFTPHSAVETRPGGWQRVSTS